MSDACWLVGRALAQPRMRLFCFAHAGGNPAEFFPWQTALAPDVEVCALQLPGRGARCSEPPATEMAPLVEAIAQVVSRRTEVPFALFGHSLGAILAFEVARRCQHHGAGIPTHLFVSGCGAPRRFDASRWKDLDTPALIRILRQMQATPAKLLEHEEWLGLVLPAIRADFSLAASYRYVGGPVLNMPVTVLTGRDDGYVSLAATGGWAAETSAICKQYSFSGDHFFIRECHDEVIACLKRELAF